MRHSGVSLTGANPIETKVTKIKVLQDFGGYGTPHNAAIGPGGSSVNLNPDKVETPINIVIHVP